MMTTLQDQVILITGASRGIGSAIAEACAQSGAHVIINYKSNTQAAQKTVSQCQAHGGIAEAIQADINQRQQVDEMMHYIQNNYGKLSCVVNNAFRPFEFNAETRQIADEMNWQDYATQFEGALLYTHNVIQAALPYLKQQQAASIINMTTNLIKRPIVPYHSYNVAKSALEAYTKNLAIDLGKYGIRVNCVAPGLVYPTNNTLATKEQLKQQLIQQTPLGRYTVPDDIAGPVMFLASDWSRFMTGQVLYVDGGLTI